VIDDGTRSRRALVAGSSRGTSRPALSSVVRAVLFLVLLGFIGAEPACIVYRVDRVEEVAEIVRSEAARPTVALAVRDGAPGRVAELYRESGLFAEVRPSFEEADLRAEVDFSREDEQGPSVVLHLLTLFVFPARQDTSFRLKTTFRNTEGEEIVTIERSVADVAWTSLLLLPAAPFNSLWHPRSDPLEEMVISTLEEASRLISSVPSPARGQVVPTGS
jgi:hypothetical protein